MNHSKMRERGFTLIEAIITLVILSIMATMFFTYSGSKAFLGSVNPIQWLESANKIHLIMERITADYQGYPRWKPNTDYATTDSVTPINRNGYFYQPVANCNSGEAEPLSWQVITDTVNKPDLSTGTGSVCTWMRPLTTVNYPNPIMPLSELRRKIAGVAVGGTVPRDGGEGLTVTYGGIESTAMQYKIVDNRYISPSATALSWDTDINSTAVTPPPPLVLTQYLKVTIQTANGNERLTVIFTQ